MAACDGLGPKNYLFLYLVFVFIKYFLSYFFLLHLDNKRIFNFISLGLVTCDPSMTICGFPSVTLLCPTFDVVAVVIKVSLLISHR